VRDNRFVEDRGEPIESVAPGGDAERELYLRAALKAFETGLIDAYQYTQRVKAIDRVTSAAEMAEALRGHGLSAGAGPSRPPMDAVDMALMKVSGAGVRRPPKPKRHMALVFVALVFILLIGLGVWLATRVHGISPSSLSPNRNAATGAYASGPGAPPLPLSPRK
jgi:hypothetical protein